MAFDQTTRNRLQKFVSDARKLLSEEFTQQLQNTYGLDPSTGTIAELQSLPSLSPTEQQTAKLIRDTLDHYLAASHKGNAQNDKVLVIAALERIVREQAFTILNRLAALRMAEARQFVMESVSQGYQSKGFQLYQRIAGSSLGETGQAYQIYLYSVFDELSLDLAALFDRFSSQGRLFPRETVLLELLDLINHIELEHLWAEDETIGWVYQYFNSKEERKKMRDESQAPRNSRELAVRNQFFTPRYVVEFLTDNTLGRIWYEMTEGQTALTESCQYLVRRPNEVFLNPDEKAPEIEQDDEDLSQEELLQQTVYIQHRALKDPRDIKMLDPACGSMHFGLYAFDLFEKIYHEAWNLEESNSLDSFVRETVNGAVRQALHQEYDSKEDFLAEIPKLIIENNIHGVDIDPRATQIAGLSLWLRAQKSWAHENVPPTKRPQVQRSNIVCAEPMPGENNMLREFTNEIRPRVLGQLVEVIFEKMQLAGEAGTLLKIEEEIQSAIDEAKVQKLEGGQWEQGNLFSENKWEVRKGIRYDVTSGVSEEFWDEAEYFILAELERYAESINGDNSSQKRLFAEDTAKGFAFIDLCRKKFDVVLMNPPFGEPTEKVLKLINSTYPDAVRNLYIAFLGRAKTLSVDDGFIGAITDSTFIHQNRYEKFRNSIIASDKLSLTHLISNGWGVLDAYVETACYIVGRPIANEIFMVDLRSTDGKDAGLSEAIHSVQDVGVTYKNLFLPKDAFRNLPKNTLAFWLPTELLRLFSEESPLDPHLVDARCGMSSSDNSRFYKLWWEVDTTELGENKTWSFLSNGGTPAPFVRPQIYVVNYRHNGKETKTRVADLYGTASRTIINESYYRKRGFTYGKRTESLTVQILPEGHIFSNEGQAVFPISEEYAINLLAYLNSSLIAYALNSMAGQHKEAGYVGAMPSPPSSFLMSDDVRNRTSRAILIMHECYTSIPEYQYFNSPYFTKNKTFPGLDKISSNLENLSREFSEIMKANDVELNLSVGSKLGRFKEFDNREWDLVNILYQCDVKKLKSIIASDILSYLVGCVFKRWNYKKIDFKSPIVDVDELFNRLPVFPNGFKKENQPDCNLIFEAEHKGKSAIVKQLYDMAAKVVDDCDSLISDLIVALNVSDFKNLFEGKCKFFTLHLERYSKSRRQAPIYWPLQSQLGSYTLWVYYHSLTEQTLYSCVNDYIEPKLKSTNEAILVLRKKVNRSDLEEKELAKLVELGGELKDFSEELLHIAQFWQPNLNDGVQITAAPLWKLFQHKPWQKKLKKTWEELEKGDNDWAHLAYNIWPKRVLNKCNQDRSLAIAHNVEADLWEEVEVPATRGNGTKRVWQPKELSDAELNAFIQKEISKK